MLFHETVYSKVQDFSNKNIKGTLSNNPYLVAYMCVNIASLHCSSELIEWFLYPSKHGKVCYTPASETSQALSKIWIVKFLWINVKAHDDL